MPLLNSRGDVLAGAGGAQGSVNGRPFPFPTFGGGAWLTDDTVLLAVPASSPSGSLLATWRQGEAAPTPVAEGLGANDWAAGGGRWIAWLAGYGLFGSLGHLPAAGVPSSGTPFARWAVAPDGTIAYVPDRQAGNALTVVASDGLAATVPGIWPLDAQAIVHNRATWRGGALNTPVPRPALADAITICVADLPNGERWLAYWSNARGFVVQLDGASDGYVLGTAGTFFNHHARAVAGELWVAYSRTAGEAPGDVEVVLIDRSAPREPLVVTPPIEPPIDPPVEPPITPPIEPPIEPPEPPIDPPVKPPEPSMNAIGYEHINYEGRSQEFPGNAYNLAEQNLANELSSMRVPAGVTVTLFERPQHGGRSLTLTSDAPDFRAFPGPGRDGTWNDAANSVRIGDPPALRLMRGGQYVEALPNRIVLVSKPTDAGLVALTEHNGPDQAAIRFDARFTAANVQLSIQNDGSLQTRAAGTMGPFEMEQVFCTTQPDGSSLLYRLDGDRVFGEPLRIIEEGAA